MLKSRKNWKTTVTTVVGRHHPLHATRLLIETGELHLMGEMVFCYQNCSDLLWEKIVLVIEKNFWNSGLKADNFLIFWDDLNNLFKIKGQKQFLVIECFFCFFNLLLAVSHIWWIRTIRIQIGNNYWDLETCRKS